MNANTHQIKLNFIGTACTIKIVIPDSPSYQTIVDLAIKKGVLLHEVINDLNFINEWEKTAIHPQIPCYALQFSGLIIEPSSFVEIRTAPRKRRRIASTEILSSTTLFPLVIHTLNTQFIPKEALLFIEKEVGITAIYTLPVTNLVLEDLEFQISKVITKNAHFTLLAGVHYANTKIHPRPGDTLVTAQYNLIN